VVTYQYQDWRENAATLASRVINEVVVNVNKTLKDIYEQTAEAYLSHLKALIEQQTGIKDEISTQLSDDERKLQADNDWFAAFAEKLREIERD
jgi:ABC-type Zn uptake system ZnuABC Zn-binding protein ZnuA